MSIWSQIMAERARQEDLKNQGKFPFTCADEGLNDFERYSVLGEEVGEVGKELNESIAIAHINHKKLRAELIQVAAVCVAWIENIDKRK